MTDGNSQFAVRFVGGKIRIERRGVSAGHIERLMSKVLVSLIGSPFLVVIDVRRT